MIKKRKTMGIRAFFRKAFSDMGKSAKAQHEVDRAEFQQVKAESRASFEENRGRNSFKRARAQAKKSWDDAHMSPAERAAREAEARDARIAAVKAATEAADARYEAAKKK